MSDYFDGLMRSSGLPLGHAPVLGPSPRAATPLMEVDVNVAAAEPLLGPLDVTAQAIQQAVGAPPTVRAAAAVAQPLSTPGAAMAPAPASTEPRPADADRFTTVTTGATLARLELPRPTTEVRQSSAPLPLAVRPAAEPVVSHERIIQAALRWVADGSGRVSAESGASPAAMRPAEPSVSTSTVGPQDSRPRATAATAITRPIVAEPVSRPAAAELAPPLRAVAAPLPQAVPPRRDDSVQVSIGAIHLRVDAPAPPAVQTAPPPTPRAVPDPLAVPRSGLSRRALRRI